jgi:hypothetical protein
MRNCSLPAAALVLSLQTGCLEREVPADIAQVRGILEADCGLVTGPNGIVGADERDFYMERGVEGDEGGEEGWTFRARMNVERTVFCCAPSASMVGFLHSDFYAPGVPGRQRDELCVCAGSPEEFAERICDAVDAQIASW